MTLFLYFRLNKLEPPFFFIYFVVVILVVSGRKIVEKYKRKSNLLGCKSDFTSRQFRWGEIASVRPRFRYQYR